MFSSGLLGFWLNSGKLDTAFFRFDFRDPDFQRIAYGMEPMWIANKVVRELADMYQATGSQSDVNEDSKINHVDDLSIQAHFWFQIVDLDDSRSENRAIDIIPRVVLGTTQGMQNVFHQQTTYTQLVRKFL